MQAQRKVFDSTLGAPAAFAALSASCLARLSAFVVLGLSWLSEVLVLSLSLHDYLPAWLSVPVAGHKVSSTTTTGRHQYCLSGCH